MSTVCGVPILDGRRSSTSSPAGGSFTRRERAGFDVLVKLLDSAIRLPV
jgi:hypothetical protein